MSENFDANIERFTGFASHYDAVRPSPPDLLAELLTRLAQCQAAPRVVDLGSGTGLSSRYWLSRAESVIGIEPTDAMREQAQRVGEGGANLQYRAGFSHATGLPDASADIVVCAQSLHWMDPFPTFAEAARVLRPGGVFAAYDYDWPPSTPFWQVDKEYADCADHARKLEQQLGVSSGLRQWDKETHLVRMRQSEAFVWAREILLQQADQGGAERIVGLFTSQGYVQSLLKAGASEKDLRIDRLLQVATQAMGAGSVPWLWSARLRVGYTA